MQFRCPYCGELSFSAAQKAGMVTSPVLRPVHKFFAMFRNKCANCKNEAIKEANKFWKSDIVFYVILGLAFIPIVLVVLIPFIFLYLYFLTHYDMIEDEKQKRDNIIVQFPDVLPFRKNTNEYICEVKFERSQQIEKTYVIFDDRYKSYKKTIKFTMVAGKTPKQNEKLRIITNDGQYPCTVLEVIPKEKEKNSTSEEPSYRLEQVDAINSTTKKRKNWQDPDYFN